MRRIRELSMEAGRTVKVEGKDNNLLELNRSRSCIQPDNRRASEIHGSVQNMSAERKSRQTAFITKTVQPVLDAHKEMLGMTAEINV